jgi:hypothetical protein
VIAANMRQTKAERTRELDNWKTNYEAIAQSEKLSAIESEKKRVSELEHHLNKTIADVTRDDSDLYVFREIEGETEWNKAVQARLEDFKKLAGKQLTTADQVDLAKRASAASAAFEMLHEVIEQTRSLQAELDAIRKSTPGFGGGSGSGGGRVSDPNKSYADSIVEQAAAAGAFNR